MCEPDSELHRSAILLPDKEKQHMVRRREKIPGEVRNEEKSKAGEGEKLEERERETKQNSITRYSKAKFVIVTGL